MKRLLVAVFAAAAFAWHKRRARRSEEPYFSYDDWGSHL